MDIYQVDLAQTHLKTMVSNIAELSLPQLGPVFSNMRGQEVHEALVAYRITKYFAEPVDADKERASRSIANMLSYDGEGLTTFVPQRRTLGTKNTWWCDREIDAFTQQRLAEAKRIITRSFRNFKLDFTKFKMPSGETEKSARGDVSIAAKLRDKQQWRVTHECADLFIKLCYENMALYKMALHHIGFKFFSSGESRTSWYFYPLKVHNEAKALRIDFDLFKELMHSRVLTIVHGAKLSTVPKDIEIDRVIELQPMGNMCVQLAIGQAERKCGRRSFKIDLNESHFVHKMLISDLDNATIDLRNASNSNWMTVVKWLWEDTPVLEYLLKARSDFVYDPHTDSYYEVNMLSPMGNGFTFETMTFTLLALCRSLDTFSWVFGDDIIIHRDCVSSLYELLRFCGWQINENKSFIDGSFRESCGGFYHADIGYLRSFKLEWPEDQYDLMVTCNKLFYLWNSLHACAVKTIIKETWYLLLKCVPAVAMRPHDHKFDVYNKVDSPIDHALNRRFPRTRLTDGILVTPSYFKRLRETEETVKYQFKQIPKAIRETISDFQTKLTCKVTIPRKVSKTYRNCPIDDVRSPHLVYHYLYSGVCLAPAIINHDYIMYSSVYFLDTGTIIRENVESVNV